MSVTLSCKLRNFLVLLRTNDCLIEGLKTPQSPLSVGNSIRERFMDKLFVEIQFDITEFSVIGFVLTGLFVVNESACLPYIDSS